MPLEILAAMVVAGIALSVALVRWSFGNNRASIQSGQEAVAQLLADYPDSVPHRGAGQGMSNRKTVLVSDDRRTALVMLDEPRHHFGYVQAFGSRYVTRLVGARDIRNTRLHGDGVLRLHLKDMTLPRIDLDFSQSGRGSEALQLVEGAIR